MLAECAENITKKLSDRTTTNEIIFQILFKKQIWKKSFLVAKNSRLLVLDKGY